MPPVRAPCPAHRQLAHGPFTPRTRPRGPAAPDTGDNWPGGVSGRPKSEIGGAWGPPAAGRRSVTFPAGATRPPPRRRLKEQAMADGKKIKITQTGSHIGRTEDQRGTLIGLGLNKRHRSRELVDTPEVRGMIKKVQHLVRIDEEAT